MEKRLNWHFRFGGDLSYSCKKLPNIFFFSILLFFGTFLLCTLLRRFKFIPHMPYKIGFLVSDYSVIISIIVFTLVDVQCGFETWKILTPTEFKLTRADLRGWIVPFSDENFPWYMSILAAIPGLILVIILFIQQHIASVIVNRKEHKLKKGGGYHLDLLIVGVMVGVSSVLGLPWCVATTVLSLGHVDSLKITSESNTETVGVREQRITGLSVYILIGLSVQLAPVLQYIPKPVLYGVFMHMGVITLTELQLIDRLIKIVLPCKKQPDYGFLRHVPVMKVHLFTVIQLLALGALYASLKTPASFLFPLLVVKMMGLRKILDFCSCVFSPEELFWLDNLMPLGRKSKTEQMETEELENLAKSKIPE